MAISGLFWGYFHAIFGIYSAFFGPIFVVFRGCFWAISELFYGYFWAILGLFGAISGLFYGYFGAISGLFLAYFGAISGLFLGYFWPIFGLFLGYFWVYFWAILWLFLGYFLSTLGLFSGFFQDIFSLFWGYFCDISGLFRGYFGAILGLLGYFCAIFGAICGLFWGNFWAIFGLYSAFFGAIFMIFRGYFWAILGLFLAYFWAIFGSISVLFRSLFPPQGDSGAPLPLPPGLEPLPGGPGGSLWVRGARRDLGGPYECRVDSGVPPPARAVVRLLVTYGPEMEAEPEEGAGPGVVLVPEGAESAQLRCRARGVPGVELSWERNGRSLGAGEPGSPFRELQWREGPWSSSVLSVANLSESRARLRRLFHQSHQSHQSSQSSQSPRPRYRYQNVPAAPPDWENWENWEGGNGTIGVFECVAKNERGRARRRVRLRLGDRPDPPRALRLSGVSGTSLSLTWEPGFDGGLPQHFLLRAAGPGAPPPPAALVTSGWSLTLGGLRPATPYDVTVRARNGRGDSAPARLRAATSAPPSAPPPRQEEPEQPQGGVAEGGGAPPALLGALCALGGLLLPALGAGLCCRCHFRFRWGRGRKPAEGAETPSSGSSRGPSGFGSAPKGAELHLYEEVEPWGEGQEVRGGRGFGGWGRGFRGGGGDLGVGEGIWGWGRGFGGGGGDLGVGEEIEGVGEGQLKVGEGQKAVLAPPPPFAPLP
uniref:Uncharacterized protein n=1 Tax=Taeniopygia guttata TaxID=59729 RepID=A0A674GEN9_TAEGU